ncbi:hypothetical protein GCM10011378_10630 [Hymenobacter glacieicola]|uniref:ABC transporter permease n=1 Tax=Hymenobacter glacieicola TaxID=1562124 RepID=A0ABQ1WQ27_9BACT|nr:hypothetical protein GCM10011378_10630 [Hymenobacter glacieicola]
MLTQFKRLHFLLRLLLISFLVLLMLFTLLLNIGPDIDTEEDIDAAISQMD